MLAGNSRTLRPLHYSPTWLVLVANDSSTRWST